MNRVADQDPLSLSFPLPHPQDQLVQVPFAVRHVPQANFTTHLLCLHWSARPPLLFYRFQFSLSKYRVIDINFQLLLNGWYDPFEEEQVLEVWFELRVKLPQPQAVNLDGPLWEEGTDYLTVARKGGGRQEEFCLLGLRGKGARSLGLNLGKGDFLVALTSRGGDNDPLRLLFLALHPLLVM